MSLGLHVPQRPEWICRADQQPWPCEPARLRLQAEYQGAPKSLEIFLTDQAAVAAYDRRDDQDAARALVRRIIGWARS